MRSPGLRSMVGKPSLSATLASVLGRLAPAWVAACLAGSSAHAQVVHGTISSAVGAARVPGAVVLLLDSTLMTRARALTSDSGVFTIGAAAAGRFHLRIMRIGFRPSESPAFDLQRDTTIDLALTDIPVILPALTTRDRGDCRLDRDTGETGRLTSALWEQARTALLAAAITLEREEYRFSKILHYRVYDVREHALRDITLREAETSGSAPWTSLPGERLREVGYTTEDDTGMTFYAPDIDVLLSPYFADEHCFRLSSRPPPQPGMLGIDFEPATRPRHTEIRGTLWLDSATTALQSVNFAFVNLPVSAPDTLIGGHIEFLRLTTGAWILPSWSIRMPTPTRPSMPNWRGGYGTASIGTRAHWRLTADTLRIAGGDVIAVRRTVADSVLWRRATGGARISAVNETEHGELPAAGVTVRLTGSGYGGEADILGHLRFEQIVPGVYLFEAATPLQDALEATPARTATIIHAGETADVRVALKPLSRAAAEVCGERDVGRDKGVLTGHVVHDGVPAGKVRVTVEWPGGEGSADTRGDGYYRICDIAAGKLVLVRASRDSLMVTTTVTLNRGEIVRALELQLKP